MRNSSKKREIKVWDLLKKAKDSEKNGLDQKATNGIDSMEGGEGNVDDEEKRLEVRDKKKKKKGKKRKVEDEVGDEAQVSKKHIRFE